MTLPWRSPPGCWWDRGTGSCALSALHGASASAKCQGRPPWLRSTLSPVFKRALSPCAAVCAAPTRHHMLPCAYVQPYIPKAFMTWEMFIPATKLRKQFTIGSQRDNRDRLIGLTNPSCILKADDQLPKSSKHRSSATVFFLQHWGMARSRMTLYGTHKEVGPFHLKNDGETTVDHGW